MKKKYTAPASHIKMLDVNHVFMEGMSNVNNKRGNGTQLVKGQVDWEEWDEEEEESNIWDQVW